MRIFKGVNLGGWLMMEGYLLGGRNIAESYFKRRFRSVYGKEELYKFERHFRNNFIEENDFKLIAGLGADCVRLPFNFRIIGEPPFSRINSGFRYLDKAFDWAEKYRLKIILDLHAACGAQNKDWHADSMGSSYLWSNSRYRERTYILWEAVAQRYKYRDALLGYDVLNEPVVGKKDMKILTRFYSSLIKRIRAVDKKHTIFLEGNLWAQRIEFIEGLLGEDIAVSIHAYQPLDYTFNFIPYLSYPGRIGKVLWNKRKVYNYLRPYYDFSRRNKVDIFVGEFGVNFRGGHSGEISYLGDILEVFDSYHFSYTYWTYKAISGFIFPNGIYQYISNPDFLSRQGPVFGWENYFKLWGRFKSKIIKSWRTSEYTFNKDIGKVLKKYFNKKSVKSS